MGLVDVVVGILANDDDLDGVEGRITRPVAREKNGISPMCLLGGDFVSEASSFLKLTSYKCPPLAGTPFSRPPSREPGTASSRGTPWSRARP